MLRRPLPPLLFRHDPSRVAGRILDLSHGAGGCLRIRCEVTDEEAKRCGGFSVACTVHAYELHDVDDRDKFHALITDATIDECSVTDRPANGSALVLQRYRQLAAVEFYDIAGVGIRKIIEMVEVLQRLSHTTADQQPAAPPAAPARTDQRLPSKARARPPVITPPRRPTQFSQLVQEMNR